MSGEPSADVVGVVGVVGGEVFGARAQRWLDQAEVVVGSTRHLDAVRPRDDQERVVLTARLDQVVDEVSAAWTVGRPVVVLASGDPGFFGIVRLLAERLGSERLDVHPAPSSVSLAFARLGERWDDAQVVSVHGRDLAAGLPAIVAADQVAVLTDPTSPPEAVAKAVLEADGEPRRVAVVSRLGEPDEQVVRGSLEEIAGGQHDPMSVVVLTRISGNARLPSTPTASGPTVTWGRSEQAFDHRGGMITKSEVRAVALGKLALPPVGVLWDVGAGSGSVGIEAAALAPDLRVVAVERDPADARRIRANASRLGVSIDVVVGTAPEALTDLPDPDRVFVGGGGLDVVRAGWERLAPGGTLVATFVLLDRAIEARRLLGDMVQIQVNRAADLGGHGVRLEPQNPVFVCWGQR